MRYYAKIDPSGDDHKFLSPPKTSFSITEILNGIASFEFIIQNTSGNRTILSDHVADDFQICRVSDDLVLLTGSIDCDRIEYFSENEANPDRIRLTGFASYIDLAYLLFKRLADADAQAVDKVFDLDASGPTYTDYTTAANNDAIDDVLLTFGAVDDAHYIGQDETFSIIKTKYSTKGDYDATVVYEYWNGSAWVAVDTLDAITYIDESRGFTKDPGTYYLVLSGKPSDWAKTTVNSVEKYWIRIRISVWTSTTTAPKLDRIWIGDTDIYRVQFDNIAADTILGYVLDGTGYSEDAVDQCPVDLISMRMEYESRLRCVFGIAKALTWDDGGDKKAYDCWITTDKKVHFKQQRGSAKGDISADLTVLGNAEGYQGIGNRIFGLGSFDGINQKRAIVENQSSQDSYSLREIFHKDMRFSHEVTLKELIQKELTNSKAPRKEVSCEIETKYWLDNSLAVGDEVTIDQPDWNVSAQTYRIMLAAIGPSRTTLDLGVVQVHLENIRSHLQDQLNIDDVWMKGSGNVYQESLEVLSSVSAPGLQRFYVSLQMEEINRAYLRYKVEPWRKVSDMDVLPDAESITPWTKKGTELAEINPAGKLHLVDDSDVAAINYGHNADLDRLRGYTIKIKLKVDESVNACSNEYYSAMIIGNDKDRNWVLHFNAARIFLFLDGTTLPISNENIGTGNGIATVFSGSLAHTYIFAGLSLEITDTVETFSDDCNGVLTGDQGGSGTINYVTGAYSVTFNAAPGNGQAITVDYEYFTKVIEWVMDTTDDYHTYLIKVINETVKVYVDGTERIDGEDKYTGWGLIMCGIHAHYNESGVYFGCGMILIAGFIELLTTQATILIDYVKYFEDGCGDIDSSTNPDDLTLKCEIGKEGETLTEVSGSPATLDQTKINITSALRAVGKDGWLVVQYTPSQTYYNVFSSIFCETFLYSK